MLLPWRHHLDRLSIFAVARGKGVSADHAADGLVVGSPLRLCADQPVAKSRGLSSLKEGPAPTTSSRARAISWPADLSSSVKSCVLLPSVGALWPTRARPTLGGRRLRLLEGYSSIGFWPPTHPFFATNASCGKQGIGAVSICLPRTQTLSFRCSVLLERPAQTSGNGS